MSSIPTHKERRSALNYQGAFKVKRNMGFRKRLEFMCASVKSGIKVFKEKQDFFEKSIAEQLEAKELAMIATWKASDYSEGEIKKLREAWSILTVKDLSTWHADKKLARTLMKEVSQSKAKRVNG